MCFIVLTIGNYQLQLLNSYVMHRDEILDEFIRHEGLAGRSASECASCQDQTAEVFCCQECMSDELYCKKCMVDGHQNRPLHRVKVHLIDILCYLDLKFCTAMEWLVFRSYFAPRFRPANSAGTPPRAMPPPPTWTPKFLCDTREWYPPRYCRLLWVLSWAYYHYDKAGSPRAMVPHLV